MRTESSVTSYEATLDEDARWALMEGSRHFEENSAVFTALHRIAKRLEDLEIPYAVVGGMALFHHGLRRFTEDIDILVSKDALKRIHAELDGRGYVPPHRHSKNLRDTEQRVRIEFRVAGEFPGDGKPKPVAFPDPSGVSSSDGDIRYIELVSLIELKLASGMSQSDRLKDLADVQQLSRILNLSADFAGKLSPYVREKYIELCGSGMRRFVSLWRAEGLGSGTDAFEEWEEAHPDAAEELRAIRLEGIEVESGDAPWGFVRLVTTDPTVAANYDMVEESEYWSGGEA